MLLGIEGFASFAVLLFWIWALLDCIATDSAMCRNLPKLLWIVLVVILPVIGAVAWLLLGRPEKAHWRPGSTDYSSSRGPVAVEDAPRYSSTPIITDRRSRELDAELERWEQEQRRRGESGGRDPEATL
jgi:hypothetical protein